MKGIRILIALAAVALAAFVAAAPASPKTLGIGSPLHGDNGGGLNLPVLGGGGSGGGGGGGGGRGGGGRGGGSGARSGALDAGVTLGGTSARVHVSCIRANVLDISARVGTCNRGRRGNGGGNAGGPSGDRGAADARARSGSLGAALAVGCIDIGLGALGDGLKVGSCANGGTGGQPGGGGGDDDDPGDGGSGELPANAGGGVAGTGTGGSGAGGGGGSATGLDSCPASQLSSTVPYGVPTWLAALLGVGTFLMGALVARRRRPQVEDVAV